ncbi:MAG: hypothetical protein N2312_03040 [Dictyoglomaceae bacterium]|nr:hypothetical protein [Dictyoglomaceae bacterium]
MIKYKRSFTPLTKVLTVLYQYFCFIGRFSLDENTALLIIRGLGIALEE